MMFSLLLILGLGHALAHNLSRISVDPDSHFFKDEHGRVVILRGVNSVAKEFPWYQEVMFDDVRTEHLKQFGFNVVRLGAMWAGAEPQMGEFNQTYLEVEERLVERLGEAGVYSILDMHQDCISSYADPPLYEGVPRWLTDLFPPPRHAYPWPLTSLTTWEQAYLTQAVSEAFQHLYDNTGHALEHWRAFWEEIARRFHGNSAVLGYNLINEPWLGDYIAHPSLALSGVAGDRNLLPVYDFLVEGIRAFDRQALVLYEPVFYGQLLSSDVFGSGFSRVPGGRGQERLSAFSFHTYCWLLEFIADDATVEDRQAAIDRCEHYQLPLMFNSAQKNVRRTGGANMLTEFGQCNGYGDFGYPEPWLDCDVFLGLADEHLMSWTEWEYWGDKWYGEGGPKWGKILPHVRPYARATAGTPLRMHFNTTDLHFRFEFEVDPSIAEPTELFVPSLRYLHGYSVEVSSNLAYTREGDLLLLSCRAGAATGDAGRVHIRPLGEGLTRDTFAKYYY